MGEYAINTRRRFLKQFSLLLVLNQLATSCWTKAKSILLTWIIPNKHEGHRLITMDFPPPSAQEKVSIVIVGGGMSGLCAGYRLKQLGVHDFKILELEAHVGGNSRYHSHHVSDSPLGAHYLPLPNMHDQKLINFLSEMDILEQREGALPTINPDYLCYDLQERLFIFNKWQEDIVPKSYSSEQDAAEIKRFYEQIYVMQYERDASGKYYFDIPIKNSSTEDKYRILDKITMTQWLAENNFQSDMLKSHLDYCCRDDFGLGIAEVSAWAGLHYFAGRKTKAWEHYNDTVITSARGNGFIVDKLRAILKDNIVENTLVFNVKTVENGVLSQVYDIRNKASYILESSAVVLATPQYINARLLTQYNLGIEKFYYNPWVVAHIILRPTINFQKDALAWDNVIFGSKGLGYIYNQHQDKSSPPELVSITYYYTLTEIPLPKRRRFAYKSSLDYWKEFIIKDLEIAHYDIREQIVSIDINIWGHGMISPRPGFIFDEDTLKNKKSIDNRIFFAHTDSAGISIFEEALHQGLDAADDIYTHYNEKL